MNQFIAFNNVPDAGIDRGDGVYIATSEIAAFEGLYDAARQPYTVIHMKSGTKFTILGRAHYMLEQARKDAAKQEPTP